MPDLVILILIYKVLKVYSGNSVVIFFDNLLRRATGTDKVTCVQKKITVRTSGKIFLNIRLTFNYKSEMVMKDNL